MTKIYTRFIDGFCKKCNSRVFGEEDGYFPKLEEESYNLQLVLCCGCGWLLIDKNGTTSKPSKNSLLNYVFTDIRQ